MWLMGRYGEFEPQRSGRREGPDRFAKVLRRPFEQRFVAGANDCSVPGSVSTVARGDRLQSLHSCR
jgi:hypothetical protein